MTEAQIKLMLATAEWIEALIPDEESANEFAALISTVRREAVEAERGMGR